MWKMFSCLPLEVGVNFEWCEFPYEISWLYMANKTKENKNTH